MISCEAATDVLLRTLGDTLSAEDADLAPGERVAMLEHLAVCASCARVRDELRDTGAELRAALVPDPWAEHQADEDLVRRVTTHPTVAGTTAPVAAGASGASGATVHVLRRRFVLRAAAALLVGVVGWGAFRAFEAPRPDGPSATEVAAAPYRLAPPHVPGYDGPRFLDVTADSGIDATDHTGHGASKDWMIETTGHGAVAFDMDADGDLDLFIPDGNRFDPEEEVRGTWRLYRNDGGMRFTDVTADAGLSADGWGCGAVAGDVDADGLPDLFVACFGENRFYRNLGNGRFRDDTARAGLAGLPEEWSSGAALGDTDGDGDLDLYVANYADMRRYMQEAPSGRACVWRSMPVACGPTPLAPQRDRLYRNRGDGTFEDVSEDALPGLRRYSFQPVLVDLDGDGALDVYVAADAQPNVLLMNDGTGRFEDLASRAGCAADGQGKDQASMGVAAGDVDGDGRIDLFVTNFSHEPNTLYRNLSAPGRPAFGDVTSSARLLGASVLTLGWGTTLADLDTDGDLDLVYANGHLYPNVEKNVPETTYRQHVSVQRNDGDGRFTDVSSDAGDGIVPRSHRGLTVADFDDDGHPDLFLTVLNGKCVLLRNDGRGAGRAARFLLRRRDGRTEAAGAVLRATSGTADAPLTQTRVLLLGSSFGSGEDPRVPVALPRSGGLTKLTVRWPGGGEETFPADDVGAGVHVLTEGSGRVRRLR